MIKDAGVTRVRNLGLVVDLFVYGLGYESRSLTLSRAVKARKYLALKFPNDAIFSFEANVADARSRNDEIIEILDKEILLRIRQEFSSEDKIRIAIDISSMNREMIFQLLKALVLFSREFDEVLMLYCPSSYSKPSLDFPQIERLGPVDALFSSYNGDPSLPICLVLGAGFEAGVSMGIVSQLEPEVGFCFWGGGIDKRFDRAVKRANFDFDFHGYGIKPIRYDITDPIGTYRLVEGITYGLSGGYQVVYVLRGPKIFSVIVGLVAMRYIGSVSVWRVEHSRDSVRDAEASSRAVWIRVNVARLLGLQKKFNKLCE